MITFHIYSIKYDILLILINMYLWYSSTLKVILKLNYERIECRGHMSFDHLSNHHCIILVFIQITDLLKKYCIFLELLKISNHIIYNILLRTVSVSIRCVILQ